MLIRLVDFLETYFEPSFSWGAAAGAGSFNFNFNKLFLPSLGTGLVVNLSKRPLPLSEAQSRS